MACACVPRTRQADTSRLPLAQGQPGLHSALQDSLSYRMRPWLKSIWIHVTKCPLKFMPFFLLLTMPSICLCPAMVTVLSCSADNVSLGHLDLLFQASPVYIFSCLNSHTEHGHEKMWSGELCLQTKGCFSSASCVGGCGFAPECVGLLFFRPAWAQTLCVTRMGGPKLPILFPPRVSSCITMQCWDTGFAHARKALSS